MGRGLILVENTILQGLIFDATAGHLAFKDVRYLLIRPETLAAFQKAVEAELGARAGELLYQGGFTGGSLSARRYREVFGYSDREIVDFMCRMGGEIGWGRFELKTLDAARGELVVEVARSPFAEAYGPATVGVCHLIRGVLGGLGAGIFGKPVHAEEVLCLAKGDAVCKFVISSPCHPHGEEVGGGVCQY